MAERHEIADAIDSLAVHCRPPLMSVEDRSRWTADWCEDLREFPIEAIRNACKRWREGTNPKFPLLGQLLPLIRAGDHQGVKGAAAEPWRPLSDDEYRSLSLNGKMRHQQIMAHKCRTEAGPMWRGGQNGEPVSPEEMPAKWHDLQARAKAHDREWRRLRDHMKTQDQSA